MPRFSGRQTPSHGAHTDQSGQFHDNRKGSIKDPHTHTKGVMRSYRERKRWEAEMRQKLAPLAERPFHE